MTKQKVKDKMTLDPLDIDKVAKRIVEMEKPTIDTLVTDRRRADWIKILIGSILTIVGIFATTAMDLGGYRENMRTLNALVHTHIDEYTPAKAAQLFDLEKKVAVNTEIISDIRKDLDDIKRQQAELIRLLSKQHTENSR